MKYIQEKQTLKNSFSEIKKVREGLGEKDFRLALESLDADSDIIKDVSEIVRHFDEGSKTFGMPYQRTLAIIGNDSKRRELFLKTVRNFEPGRRNYRGFNAFAAELRLERDEMAALLKKYNKLYPNRHRLSDAETNKFRKFESSIPRNIRELVINIRRNEAGKFRPKYKEIAAKWMVKYYPCTEKTLVQIIRQASKNPLSTN
jgi:hypothetical protein